MKLTQLRNIGLIFLLGVFVTACSVQKSPITGNKRAYGYSWDRELEIGKEADQQIQQQYGVYDDEQSLQYVKEVGNNVLEVSHFRREDTPKRYRDTEFHFRLLDSPVVNAFALPGGYVYVTRGLMSHLNNEAQLAVVLGHEIGHVAARHASQGALEQKLGQVALVGGAVLGQELLGVPGGNILDIGGTAAQLLFTSYSRDDERESDELGVEYAAKKQYKAAEGAEFFTSLKRLSEKSDQSLPSFLSTHPDPAEREKSIPETAEQWREKGYEQTIINKDKYMNRIDGMIFGDNPRQGFARDGMFYHPDLKFKFDYPDSWNIINQPSLVATVNEEQDAVSIMRIDNESGSPRSSVINYVSQDGFTVQSQSEASHNGLDGYEAVASAMAEDSTKYRFYVYGVSYGDSIYRFTSYSIADKFAAYRPQFEETSNSFAELADQQILDIEPVRIQAFRTERTDSFSSFLPESLPMDTKAEDLAIVNQVELDETIEKGSWIKIPRQ